MTCRTGKGIIVSGGYIFALYLDSAAVLVEIVEGIIEESRIALRLAYRELAALRAVLFFLA